MCEGVIAEDEGVIVRRGEQSRDANDLSFCRGTRRGIRGWADERMTLRQVRECVLKSDLGNESFVAVPDDGDDAGDRGEFFGSALGVTAGSDDASRRVETAGAADIGAGLAIGFGGDAAGIDDDHVGFGGLLLLGA